MSQSVVPATGEEKRAADQKASKDAAKEADQNQPKQLDDLHTEHGDTTIEDTVVAKIAGIATREVSGVYAMGNAAGRAISGITARVTGRGQQNNVTSGVSVDKGEYQTAVDVSVVVAYGSSIVEVSQQIRDNVIQAVEYATGLEVVSVDVNVSDVHLPDDDTDDNGGGGNSGKSEDDLR